MGNELEFRVTAFCSRRERICLITCGSSILAMTLTAPPHASQVDISISPKAPTFGEYSFQALCPAHGGMLLHRRSLIAVYLAFGALASFRRRHQGSVFAIGLMRHSDEHAMEACQIGSRPGYQGCQACDKVQWFEDDVGSTGPKAFAALMGPAFAVRCFQLVADVAARCQRQAPFRYCRAADVSTQALQFLAFIRPGRHARMQGESGYFAC